MMHGQLGLVIISAHHYHPGPRSSLVACGKALSLKDPPEVTSSRTPDASNPLGDSILSRPPHSPNVSNTLELTAVEVTLGEGVVVLVLLTGAVVAA